MSTGHLFVVIRMPNDPPPVEALVVQQSSGDGLIRISATPDQRLRFQVIQESQPIVDALSHTLTIEESGYTLLEVSWDQGSVSMSIGGNQVTGLPETTPPVRVTQRGANPDPILSLNDPDALNRCEPWVDWRQKKYGTPKSTPRKGHRLKTLIEQLNELARARAGLIELVQLLMAGRGHVAGHVATDLRALLHWNGPSYRPLLLRMAARFSLPLPIYYVPMPEAPPVVQRARTHLVSHSVSMVRQLTAHRLADLQEWLNAKTFTLNPTGSDDGARRPMSIRSAIHATSSTMGTAHYDEDLSIDLEAMYSIIGPQTDELTQLLASASNVTIPLCQYVLITAEQRLAAA